jgi:N-formylglutamate deformylase
MSQFTNDRPPFFITIPHSGEKIPPEASWLADLDEVLLMYDVDRFVDQIYEPALSSLKIPFVKTEWHRYAIDLNRASQDIDQDSVIGAEEPSGKHPRGLHWSITTDRIKIMTKPMPAKDHETLVHKYFDPFHLAVQQKAQEFLSKYPVCYHIDAHSMPSVGTLEHRDPGERRADVVVSDCHGKSCSAEFKDLVIKAYSSVGLKVAYNWPYFGGKITEIYGRPSSGHHTIQVELNRALYMDEKTKKRNEADFKDLSEKVNGALKNIVSSIREL